MPSISSPEKKADAAAEDSPFTLRNASTGFEGRSTDIFGQLDVLERQHASHEQSRTDLEEFADLRQPEDKDSDDTLVDTKDRKRSVPSLRTDQQERDEKQLDTRRPARDEPHFRRPAGRPPGRQRGRSGWVPDHGSRPNAWTHYTLDDVAGSDMSDRANAQAALAFLDEQRKLKAAEEMEGEEEEAFDVGSAACSKGAFSFAKRSKSDKPSDDARDKDRSSESHSPVKLKAAEEMEGEEEEAFDVGSAACSKGAFSFAKRSKSDKPSDDARDKDRSSESHSPAKLKAAEEMEGEEEEAFDVGSAACSKGAFSFAKRSKSDKPSDDARDKDRSSESHSPIKLKAVEGEEEEAFDVGSAACSKGAFSFAKRSKSDKPSDDARDKDRSSESHSPVKESKTNKSASDARLGASSDAEADLDAEQTLDEEPAGSSSSSSSVVEKTDTAQAGFKSRKKGIRRNIRARDDD